MYNSNSKINKMQLTVLTNMDKIDIDKTVGVYIDIHYTHICTNRENIKKKIQQTI